MSLRDYQQETLDSLYAWWIAHPGVEHAPILTLPTGAGKSHVIAELTRLLFEHWPESHPRTVVIVPSKELAEQNAEKLQHYMPDNLKVGYYSASVGKKEPDADVIVATIGSVAKSAHLLGNIRCVIIDECHLVNPDGAGQYRQFIRDLSKYCEFRVVGLTATPFRGNGIWLTDGADPLFTGIAHEVSVKHLLDNGFLSPLVRPVDALETRIDTSDLSITNGDYTIDELEERVDGYLPSAAAESIRIATDRRKWIAFLPTVAGANHFAELLNDYGVVAHVVCGETKKSEREELIAAFKRGEIRCLVTVMALATGFDVPDVDCIIWLRPTQSPVLYVQGSGRGLRIAEGKTDCLWIDFSDTTERLGPVDAIRGRRRRASRNNQAAPFAVCDSCGAQVRPASALFCPECGARLREEEEQSGSASASNAAVMSHQIERKLNTYQVTSCRYSVHRKEGSPPSMRVDYFSGMRRVASEWVCFEHTGFARQKAAAWWAKRMGGIDPPATSAEAVGMCDPVFTEEPTEVVVDETEKYPKIVSFKWREHDQDGTRRQDQLLQAGAQAFGAN